jgi:tellurite resistance protein
MTRAKSATSAKQRLRTDLGARGRSTPHHTRSTVPRLTVDEAFIALLIGAMDANRHVSREELARAHHIIWSMRRYRRASGERVGRLIDAMRTLIEERGALPTIDAAARVIPARLRPAAFALSADLVLADGKMEPAERRFLDRLGSDLELPRQAIAGILDAMLVKNSA